MYQRLLFILIIIIIPNNLNSQNNPDSLKLSLDRYYEYPRESIFLHINKTDFITGEIIWFKGYIQNRQSSKPFLETTNVYVTLYDSLGKLKDEKLYLANNGYLTGSLKLDSTYASGNYYLKAETSWMQNFKDAKPFLEKIRIIDETVLNTKPEKIIYDVQFLPEGGNMLVETKNVVGVKSINNYGYGVEISKGEIIDEDGKLVTTFSTKVHGLGKFMITPVKGVKYSAKLEFADGSMKTYNLPESSLRGIAMTVKNNYAQKKIAVTFKTNEQSLNSNNSLLAYCVVHKDDNSFIQKIEFDQSNLDRSILLDKAKIETGVNTITLFNENFQPVSERNFFNNNGFKLPQININKISKANDSIILDFNVLSEDEGFNFSVSALPAKTTNKPTNSIVSQFYLEPYVKGFIESPSYYFENFSAEKLFHLDLLFLTQGWNRYDWQEIFNESNKINHPFERGLTLVGILNEDQEESDILFHNSKYHIMKTFKFPENENTFTMPGIFVEKGEKLKFSKIDRKEKLKQPSMYLRIERDYKTEELDLIWLNNPENTLKDFSSQKFSEFITNFNSIELETVELTGERKKNIPRTRSVPAYIESRITLVDQNIIRNFPNITDLLRSKGYVVREGLKAFDGGSASEPISRIAIRSRRNADVLLILDGIKMPTLEPLYNLSTAEVESFFFDKVNTFEGISGGFNEILYIYTRIGPSIVELNRTSPEEFLNFSPDIAFEKPKEYYSPKYNSYSSEPFKKYGSIHWIPDLKTIKKNMRIKLPSFGINTVKLFIEGMNSRGALISKEIILDLNDK